jgi:hypothetical protein
MSRIPEYGTPCADSPEITGDDIAYARRRDGSLVDPVAFARNRLPKVMAQLDCLKTDDLSIQSIRIGLREIERALRTTENRVLGKAVK